jgi:hypothetical protein
MSWKATLIPESNPVSYPLAYPSSKISCFSGWLSKLQQSSASGDGVGEEDSETEVLGVELCGVPGLGTTALDDAIILLVVGDREELDDIVGLGVAPVLGVIDGDTVVEAVNEIDMDAVNDEDAESEFRNEGVTEREAVGVVEEPKDGEEVGDVEGDAPIDSEGVTEAVEDRLFEAVILGVGDRDGGIIRESSGGGALSSK